MLEDIITAVTQNKNLLMLVSVGYYILALFAVLSNHLFIISFIITILFLYLLVSNKFSARTIIIWTLIFYLGVINTSLRLRETDELLNLAPRNSEIYGTVISIPQGWIENKPKFYFKVDKIRFGSEIKELKNEKVLVTVNVKPDKILNKSDIKPYNSYLLKGRLSTPFKAGNPSQFDYGNYLKNYNTYSVFYANEIQELNIPLSIKGKCLQRINNFRENILKVHSKYLQSPNLEILGGIVFGDDAVAPSKEIKQSFINSGLLHILAASGMNVAFIYSFFFLIMSTFRTPFKLNITLSIIMVLIYTLMTGMGASVVRASLMLTLVLVGKLIDRDANSVSLLSFVAFLMLIYNPMYINDVGFQLSFIVTFGILITAPAVVQLKNRILDFIVGNITIPIIAQLWVIPIQIFYFSNISVYSVFANIMSVVILMIVSFGGFISSLLSVISPIADFVCRIFDFILNPLISLLVNISDFWGNLPNSTFQTTHPSVMQILLYYGILLSVISLFYKDFREKYLKRILKTIGISALILLLTFINFPNKNLEITVFDVGNADSFLIKTPENKYFMIDTGKSGYNGGKSQAEIIMIKFLKDRGIKELEGIIITHFDNDHCGGASDIMKNIKVNKLYVNSLEHKSYTSKIIYQTAKSTNTPVILTKNKDVVYDKSNLTVTNFIYNRKELSDNNKSIITLVKFYDFTMLFTGDAGVNALMNLKNNFPQNITVFKVPHHGATGVINKELVAYLNPKYSIVSVGENKFGHPSLYTLSMLSKSLILRTDISNSILIKVNKKQVKLLNYNNKEHKYTDIK